MAVLPDTYIASTPGAFTQNVLDARDQNASFMERKQRLAMAQEQQDMERAKFQAYMPAIVAKQKADMVSAAAAIANTARMEELRKKAAENSVDYNDRFLNIMTIPDLGDRSDSLAAFQGEIGWLDSVPEYKGFVDAVDNAQAKTFTKDMTLRQIQRAVQVSENAGEVRKEVAGIQAGQRIETAGIRADTQLKLKQIDADTKLGVEDKRAQRTSIQLQSLQRQAAEADQDAADAARDGNTQLAATYRQNAANFRDAIEKTTTFAGTGQSAPRTAAQDPKPTTRINTSEYPTINPPFGGKASPSDATAPVRQAVQQAVLKPIKGTRTQQNGIIYQFDGSTWNAVGDAKSQEAAERGMDERVKRQK